MATTRTLEALAHLHNKPVAPTLSRIVRPRFTFDSVEEYETIYRRGTEFEMNLEKNVIDKFNAARHVFRAWIYCRLKDSDGHQHWIFAVGAGVNTPDGFPAEGGKCLIAVYDDPAGEKQVSREWLAVRIDASSTPLKGFIFFKVSLRSHIAASLILTPLVDMESPTDEPPVLDSSNMRYVVLTLDEFSDPTSEAELGALDALINETGGEDRARSSAAFDWLRTFKDPAFSVDLFTLLPHMEDSVGNLDSLPTKLREQARNMNPLQKQAYSELLRDLPCGVGIIPGGPGGGKTFFNMYLIAMAQAKPLEYMEEEVKKQRRVKVLFVLGINKGVDDATNKCIKMSESLGDDKVIVRMFGWNRELAQGLKSRKKESRDKPEDQQDDKSDDKSDDRSDGKPDDKPEARDEKADLTANFLLMAQMSASDRQRKGWSTVGCRAPSLDQLAFKRFEEHKADYEELEELLQEYLSNACFDKMRSLREETYKLYADTLEGVDFVACTPVAATSLAGGKFKPDILVFDESAYSRELSTLIGIAHFSPMAWIFTGDFRQTGPFLASKDRNPSEIQMRMSVMERAHYAGAIKQRGLLMNHRAYGGLHYMPSNSFYNGRMVSGLTYDAMFPESVNYMRSWLERFTLGGRIAVPRLVLHVMGAKMPTKVGSSFYNEDHQLWVMERVRELMVDPNFRSLDGKSRGTIMIIAPYRESLWRYRKALRDLQSELRGRVSQNRKIEEMHPTNSAGGSPVDSSTGETETEKEGRSAETATVHVDIRTVETAQGHEADMVFVDLVRERATDFLDDGKRLAVATTRSRQGEIYMIHTSMVPTLVCTRNLGKIYEACRSQEHGRVAWV